MEAAGIAGGLTVFIFAIVQFLNKLILRNSVWRQVARKTLKFEEFNDGYKNQVEKVKTVFSYEQMYKVLSQHEEIQKRLDQLIK